MSKNGSIFLTKASVITTFIICLIIGFVCALIVSREVNGYAAGKTIGWVVLSILCPLIAILLITAGVTAVGREFKITSLSLISCLLIPVSFISFVKFFELTGISVYTRQNAEQLQGFSPELKERIVIEFKDEINQEDIKNFETAILRKKIQSPNGDLSVFADGICGNIHYPNHDLPQVFIELPFCNSATADEKNKLKQTITDSPIVKQVYENTTFENLKKNL